MTKLRRSGIVALRAIAIAVVCCLVAATRVYLDIDPVRIKVLNRPAVPDSGTVRVQLTDARIRELPTHTAVIVRIHNLASTTERFTIRLGERFICEASVAADATRRVDCVVVNRWEQIAGAPPDIVVSASRSAWQLDYLEVATQHGSATNPLRMFVLPAASEAYRGPGPIWIAAAGLSVIGLLLLPAVAITAAAPKYGIRALRLVAILLFGLAILSPFISPYRVVLSDRTFAGWITAALLPQLLWIVVFLRPYAQRAVARVWTCLTAIWAPCAAGSRSVAWALAFILFGIGVVFGTRALGGSDTYGYVSQADLWLRGSLKIDQAFALSAPWPDAPSAFAPIGHVPSPRDNRFIVPVYSPGLPIMLAIAKSVAGQTAMFWVVPLCAALLVVATYEFGRRIESRQVGLIGAWLVATSPVVVAHALITMTDVPVAAAWTAAFCLLIGTTRRASVGAGLLASVAIMIRPNLAPLAAVMVLRYGLDLRASSTRRRAVLQGTLFSLAVLPGAIGVAVTNQTLFGSPLYSGYGAVTDLFVLSDVVTNLRNYLGWFVEAHTPIALIGMGAMAIPLRSVWPSCRDRRMFAVVGAFVAVLWTIYCLWGVFDSWWFLRFLLPSLPFIMLGVGASVMALARAAPSVLRPAVIVGVIVLGVMQFKFAVDHRVFEVKMAEGRNVDVARMARQLTRPGSVLISFKHSGSLRYYAGRMTINYANLESTSLDPAVDWLIANALHPYLLVEDDEVSDFRERRSRPRSWPRAGRACRRTRPVR